MTKKITLFEIRLDQDVLVLRGGPEEAPAVQLSGKLVLSCTEPISAKSLTIKVTALQRFRASEIHTGPWGPISKNFKWEQLIWTDRTIPINDKTTIPAGNHEYPFQWIIRGDHPESVEGWQEASVLWDVHAHLERTMLASDQHATKHFRVIRTLPQTALEFTQSMAVENVWPNKVEYSVSSPCKAVIFGSFIPITIRLNPLLKGLTVTQIVVSLKENYELTPQLKQILGTRSILETTFPGFDDLPREEDEGSWILNEKVFLPQSLAKCLQDCDAGRIKIRHKLKFSIQLKNPDGHLSELRASLPIQLFISQHYLTNEQNQVPQITNQVTTDSEISAPPRYEAHKLDQLWEGVDLDMYLSRTNSPTVLSRSGSAENLQAHSGPHSGFTSGLASVGSISGTSSPLSHDISTAHTSNVSSGTSPVVPSILTTHGHADLVARLQRAHQRTAGSSGSLNALANSTTWTAPSSGRESPNPESPTESHTNLSSSPQSGLDYSTINKVPSYDVAIKTPARNLTYESSPVYERVASNPPSRVSSSQNLAEMARQRPSVSRSSSTSGPGASTPPTEQMPRSSSLTNIAGHPQNQQSGSTSRVPPLLSPRWRG